jgi:60 kDa SS-A/Ro ribonucleoprotein
MARTNLKPAQHIFTHEGAPASTPYDVHAQLRRTVMSCLLWESEFYEDGQEISARIHELAQQCSPDYLASLAIDLRQNAKLRHVPLQIIVELIDRVRTAPPLNASLVQQTIGAVIQRPDEMGELISLFRKHAGARVTLPPQLKKGLARRFESFPRHALAKYNSDNAEYKIRDVMFISHPRPASAHQAETFKMIADQKLPPANTWEVALSSGADKKETFERLIRDNHLGYLALLRNLRNMTAAGVDSTLINNAIRARANGADRVLPFRFVAAARAAPEYAMALDEALVASINDLPRFKGKTIVLVDVSASMLVKLSGRSDLSREDAAAALASIINGEDVRVFAFSSKTQEVSNLRGLAGIESVKRAPIQRNSTMLGAACREVMLLPHDRLIVITDEQSNDPVPDPVAAQSYMINVASNRNGVGYRKWTHIDGFSENVIRFIHEVECDNERIATEIIGG